MGQVDLNDDLALDGDMNWLDKQVSGVMAHSL
jgi:hypothetical protein